MINKEILETLNQQELAEALIILPKDAIELIIKLVSNDLPSTNKYFYSKNRKGTFWRVYDRTGIPDDNIPKVIIELIEKYEDKVRTQLLLFFEKMTKPDLERTNKCLEEFFLETKMENAEKYMNLYGISISADSIKQVLEAKISELNDTNAKLVEEINELKENNKNKNLVIDKIKLTKKGFIVDEINNSSLRLKQDFIDKINDNNIKLANLLEENNFEKAYDYLLLNYVLIKELEVNYE